MQNYQLQDHKENKTETVKSEQQWLWLLRNGNTYNAADITENYGYGSWNLE